MLEVFHFKYQSCFKQEDLCFHSSLREIESRQSDNILLQKIHSDLISVFTHLKSSFLLTITPIRLYFYKRRALTCSIPLIPSFFKNSRMASARGSRNKRASVSVAGSAVPSSAHFTIEYLNFIRLLICVLSQFGFFFFPPCFFKICIVKFPLPGVMGNNRQWEGLNKRHQRRLWGLCFRAASTTPLRIRDS